MKKVIIQLCFSFLLLLLGVTSGYSTHCNANFSTDISGVLNPFNPSPQTLTRTCTISGCDDYFDMSLLAGQSVTLSFCNNGGTSNFDTGLSAWNGAGFTTNLVCVDDVCGLNSEMTFVAPANDTYRFRIGGFSGASGTYTLAYSASFSQAPVAGVEIPTVSEWGLIFLGLMFMSFASVSMRRKRQIA